jgi:hypothetical protein
LPIPLNEIPFTYKNFKKCIKSSGKTNKQIAKEIIEFSDFWRTLDKGWTLKNHPVKFHAYYADYDWVVFCWLFGKMINLPKWLPKYCIDLKQLLDEKASSFNRNDFFTAFDFKNEGLGELSLDEKISHLKKHVNYPEQVNEHNALDDAKWNQKLHEFLTKL